MEIKYLSPCGFQAIPIPTSSHQKAKPEDAIAPVNSNAESSTAEAAEAKTSSPAVVDSRDSEEEDIYAEMSNICMRGMPTKRQASSFQA